MLGAIDEPATFALVLRTPPSEPDRVLMLVDEVGDALDIAQEMHGRGYAVDVREYSVTAMLRDAATPSTPAGQGTVERSA
ncbi:MAG TPA: hypothetical protein VEI83_06970 [Acidimicrobiales bacterium]|nr:hypothetical protein [Acidimicrobiales bacterium]